MYFCKNRHRNMLQSITKPRIWFVCSFLVYFMGMGATMAADLKQLAEQLVNLTTSKEPSGVDCDPPDNDCDGSPSIAVGDPGVKTGAIKNNGTRRVYAPGSRHYGQKAKGGRNPQTGKEIKIPERNH